ncbi:MAG: hypothetical protein ACK5YO_28905, partial [Planctomyces sp.]
RAGNLPPPRALELPGEHPLIPTTAVDQRKKHSHRSQQPLLRPEKILINSTLSATIQRRSPWLLLNSSASAT